MPASDSIELEVSGRTVTISSPEKVFFAERGETKLDLVRYLQSIEQPLLRAIGGRPILMERYPEGASGKSFFQKRVPKSAPDVAARRSGWRRRTARSRTPWWPSTWRTCCGP